MEAIFTLSVCVSSFNTTLHPFFLHRPTTHKVPTDERSLIVDKLREHSKTIVAVVATANIVVCLLLLQIAMAVRLQAVHFILIFAAFHRVLSSRSNICFKEGARESSSGVSQRGTADK